MYVYIYIYIYVYIYIYGPTAVPVPPGRAPRPEAALRRPLPLLDPDVLGGAVIIEFFSASVGVPGKSQKLARLAICVRFLFHVSIQGAAHGGGVRRVGVED